MTKQLKEVFSVKFFSAVLIICLVICVNVYEASVFIKKGKQGGTALEIAGMSLNKLQEAAIYSGGSGIILRE